jgi:hypothetical protein
MNNEDLTIASLAKLVGGELSVVDKLTQSSGQQGTANKIDPRSFLIKNNPALKKRAESKGVVYHDGKAFYNGPDESYVQSMYPEISAPPSSPSSPVAAQPPAPVESVRAAAPSQVISSQLNVNNEIAENAIKLLKSIDKSLKTIAKNLTQSKE